MISDVEIENKYPELELIAQMAVVPTIFEVICRSTGMGFAAIAKVTDQKWIACSVRDEIQFGLQPGGELTLETTICNEIRQHHQPVVIDHVSEDENFAHHHTPAMYGFQSYISMPIIKKDGSFFGTLCAIDPRPARLNNPETIGMFRLFADLISHHLQSAEELAISNAQVVDGHKNAELRDQFIAILGHDLRNPIGAIQLGANFLLQMPLEEGVKEIVNIIRNSSYRVSGLVDNILDFARSSLGAGITLNVQPSKGLGATLQQVVDELHVIHPNQEIEISINIPEPINCDENRLAQLFSNLLGNALTHGDNSRPVIVRAFIKNDAFHLDVINHGQQVPQEVIKGLFKPFQKGDQNNKEGLGLGLFIAAEIARAHNGTLTAESTAEQTAFRLSIPVG